MSPLIIPLVTVKFKALIKKTSRNPAAHTQCGYCAALHQALYNYRISTHLYSKSLKENHKHQHISEAHLFLKLHHDPITSAQSAPSDRTLAH